MKAGGSQYLLTDHIPYQNRSYYRLKMVDENGGFIYSRIVAVTGLVVKNLEIFPNPSADFMNLHLPANIVGKIKIEVSTNNGQVIQTIRLSSVTNGTVPIKIAELLVGIYFLEVEAGTTVLQQKFIKM